MSVTTIDITPRIAGQDINFINYARTLHRQLRNTAPERREEYLKDCKHTLITNNGGPIKDPHLALAFSKSLMLDLLLQAWELRISRGRVYLDYENSDEIEAAQLEEKERVRKRHLLARDSQLEEKSVKEFIQKMERRKLTENGWHSIFSVMRDGQVLKRKLNAASDITDETQKNEYLKTCISPYIQFVEPEEKCEHTGLYLSEIWRYFRHTWVNEYKSLPGRSMSILIRDAAAPNHPVIGIAALGSSVAQQTIRDSWVGWEAVSFINNLTENPTATKAKWLLRNLEELISEVNKKDLIKDGILSASDFKSPTIDLIKKLRNKAAHYKQMHIKFPHRAKFNVENNNNMNWKERSETFLFKCKRCLLIADILLIRMAFQKHGLVKGTQAELTSALKNNSFKESVSKLIRRVKAKRVGIDMMDIIVCGSVAPYNHILGGKLVCMLLTSPEVVKYYSDKYSDRASLIASSMSGKKVIRKPNLVLLGTTSLYGVGSSQYNRIKIPANAVGNDNSDYCEYKELGSSEGYGSFHFSSETLKWGNLLVSRRKGGKRVNSIFGEGANPLMRKIREAFELLDLPSGPILKHGNRRVVYSIALAGNFREVLTGFDKMPKYYFKQTKPKLRTQLIAEYWIKRWLSNRINNNEVVDAVGEHTLSYPITHGARVPRVNQEVEPNLFTLTA